MKASWVHASCLSHVKAGVSVIGCKFSLWEIFCERFMCYVTLCIKVVQQSVEKGARPLTFEACKYTSFTLLPDFFFLSILLLLLSLF